MLSTRLGLPHTKGARCFMLAAFIDALGSGIFAPFSLLYFKATVGLPLASIGLALSIATTSALLIIPITGTLVDQIGTKRVVLISQLLQGLGFFGYLFVTNFGTLIGFAILVICGQSMFWSAYFTLIAEISAPGERDRWYGLIGAVRISALGLGGLLAGFVIAAIGHLGYNIVVIFNSASFFFAAGLIIFGVRPSPRHATTAQKQGYRVVLRDKPFLLLIGANTCFAICLAMLYLAVPIYFTVTLKLPIWFIGIELGFNTIFSALLQTLMVRWLAPFKRTRSLMGAGLIWCLSLLAFALAIFIPHILLILYLLIIICIYGIAQMIHMPISNALTANYSPEALRGRYLAIYQYSFFLANIITPSLFTFLFTAQAIYPWLAAAAIAVLGSLIIYSIEPHVPEHALLSTEISPVATTSVDAHSD